ncbi:MAG: polysaccharide export protein [Cytophagales bacterium]|jgi:polysaccharide export outer membrane protein|nr:polysaccharide export protein [Cytophagales bacterium]
MRKLILSACCLLALLPACVTHKQGVNFQGDNFPPTNSRVYPNKRTPYRLQPTDVLMIRVKGLEQTDTDFMNLEAAGTFNAFNEAAVFSNGYSISDSGFVALPVVGMIHVGGLTVGEARTAIQKAVDRQLKNSTVFVAMLSFRVSVIGEVRTPGQYYNYNNQLTLLDALARAGDVTDVADRTQVMLIRQADNGNEVVRLNLLDPNLVVSKYYYLLPNDIVYVRPLKAKFGRQNANNINIAASLLGALAGLTGVVIALTR